MTNAAILIILNGDTEILNKQTGAGEAEKGQEVTQLRQSLKVCLRLLYGSKLSVTTFDAL